MKGKNYTSNPQFFISCHERRKPHEPGLTRRAECDEERRGAVKSNGRLQPDQKVAALVLTFAEGEGRPRERRVTGMGWGGSGAEGGVGLGPVGIRRRSSIR